MRLNMSITDVEMRCFTEAELSGQPQTIIRHPDMPPEVFANRWATIKGGKPWRGRVEKRGKNGGHSHCFVRPPRPAVGTDGQRGGASQFGIRRFPERDKP